MIDVLSIIAYCQTVIIYYKKSTKFNHLYELICQGHHVFWVRLASFGLLGPMKEHKINSIPEIGSLMTMKQINKMEYISSILFKGILPPTLIPLL